MYDPQPMAPAKPFTEAFAEALAALEAASGPALPKDKRYWPDLRLAHLLGTTPTTIHRWRHGDSSPPTLSAAAVLTKLRRETAKALKSKPA